jgi:hypothetical protein
MVSRELKGIESGAFSLDGRLLVGIRRGKTAVVLDADSLGLLHEFVVMSNISSVTFSPDATRLLFIDTSGRMSMRTVSGKELWNRSARDADEGNDPVWHPEGHQFVRADWEKRLRLHDAETGAILLEAQTHKVPSLIPRDHETFIITHSELKTNLHSIIEVRRFNNLEVVSSTDLGENLGHFGIDPAMRFPWYLDWDEERNAFLNLNGRLRLQDGAHLQSLKFHPTGEEFCVVLGDDRALRYRTSDHSLLRELQLPFAHSSAYAADGKKLAIFGWKGSILVEL